MAVAQLYLLANLDLITQLSHYLDDEFRTFLAFVSVILWDFSYLSQNTKTKFVRLF